MKRFLLVLPVALVVAVMALAVAVPAFAQADVEPKECFGSSDPDFTSESCNHSVTTPSGNRNNHSRSVDEFDGVIARSSVQFNAKPARDNGSDRSKGTGPVPKHCSSFTSEQGIVETLCDHVVTTPSGNTNVNSRYAAVVPNCEVLRLKSNYHTKPGR